MKRGSGLVLALALYGAGSVIGGVGAPAMAQEQAAAVAAPADTPEPLTPDEMEVLVARIALYPDEPSR